MTLIYMRKMIRTSLRKDNRAFKQSGYDLAD